MSISFRRPLPLYHCIALKPHLQLSSNTLLPHVGSFTLQQSGRPLASATSLFCRYSTQVTRPPALWPPWGTLLQNNTLEGTIAVLMFLCHFLEENNTLSRIGTKRVFARSGIAGMRDFRSCSEPLRLAGLLSIALMTWTLSRCYVGVENVG